LRQYFFAACYISKHKLLRQYFFAACYISCNSGMQQYAVHCLQGPHMPDTTVYVARPSCKLRAKHKLPEGHTMHKILRATGQFSIQVVCGAANTVSRRWRLLQHS
jgi:hypothetical protein